MRRTWRFLSFLFLAVCFALLIFDFVQFVASGGQDAYWALRDLLPLSVLSQIATWAALEESTWGNMNRLVLTPLVNAVPLWSMSLLIALICWALGRRA